MTDQDLIAAFEARTLPTADFSHRRHLRIAWHYLSAAPLGIAAERFKAALQRYAAAHGRPHLYHETITWAYLILLNQIRAALAADAVPVTFESAMAHCPALLHHRGGPLFDYYTQDQLDLPEYRAAFILPTPARAPVPAESRCSARIS